MYLCCGKVILKRCGFSGSPNLDRMKCILLSWGLMFNKLLESGENRISGFSFILKRGIDSNS